MTKEKITQQLQTQKLELDQVYENVKEQYLQKGINYETFLKSVEGLNNQLDALKGNFEHYLVCEPIDFHLVEEELVLLPSQVANNTAIYKVAITEDSKCGLAPMIALQKGLGKYEIEVRYLGRNTKPIFDKTTGEQLSKLLDAVQELVDAINPV